MKLAGYASTIHERDRARITELSAHIEIAAAQRADNAEQRAGAIRQKFATALLEMEQRGIDISAYLEG